MKFARAFVTLILALAVSSLSLPASAAPAISGHAKTSRDLSIAYGVSVVRGSEINLVSSESRVPIQVRNQYNQSVRVYLVVRPNALWLQMPKLTELTVPAQTTVNATVPISAISNGNAELSVHLISFSGIPLTKDVAIKIHVEKDVEPILLGGFILTIGVLGVVGGLRMARRRRGARA